MPNILLLHEGERATVMTLYHQFTQFAKATGGAVEKAFAKAAVDSLRQADVIVCVRGESPLMAALLRYARSLGKYVIYFLDDDLKDVPRDAFRYPGRKKWHMQCIEQAQFLLTPNRLIAEEYQAAVPGLKTAILNTAVDERRIIPRTWNHAVTKIVYAASEGHIADFNICIRPILPELFAAYGTGIALYFVGLHPEIDAGAFAGQIHYVPGMPLAAYQQYMAREQFDLGLAPLITNHFTERKYFNKLIEYAQFGICGVYSNVMPYQLAVKDGDNGYFADNEPSDWLRQLRRAIDDKAGQRACAERAQAYLHENHSEAIIFQKLAGDIPALVSYQAPPVTAAAPRTLGMARARHAVFRLREAAYLTRHSIFRFGMRETMSRIKRKWKR
ncbi:MAG: hypothetical protein PHS97_05570 [Oscillospiraceae bacterium]|nr:hypothetical protein [Oscillospiraceae bacterium]